MHYILSATQELIVREVRSAGFKIWIVGGAVRDRILRRKCSDIDLVTNIPISIIEKILKDNNLHALKEEFETIVLRIKAKENELIDIAITQNIQDDLSRRDITINAIAQEIDDTGLVLDTLDPFDGAEDIQKQQIIFINPDINIIADPVKILRACRFSALGEKWVIQNPSIISTHAKLINSVSKERIRTEIMKGISYPAPMNFMDNILSAGLLPYIMSPVHLTKGIVQNKHHAEEVLEHLLYSFKASVEFTNKPLLRLAALFHDVGKKETQSIDKYGEVHFYKHEIVGGKITRKWMKEYKFSNKEIEYVTKMVTYHQWRFYPDSKDKTIRRWLNTVGQDWYDLIILRSCDRKGNLAKKHKPAVTHETKQLISRIENILNRKEPVFDKDLQISGKDLIRLGFKPGPEFGKILQDCWSLVLNFPERNTNKSLISFVTKNNEVPNNATR